MRHAGTVSLALLASLSACVPRAAPPPAPAPSRPMAQPAPALPAPPPPPADWRDLPLTAGTWAYSDGTARFGLPGAAPLFTLRCDRAGSVVLLSRGEPGGDRLTLRTSYTARTLPAEAGVVRLNARDAFLDGIAFSRGRFSVESAGAPMLVLPAWAEPARVVEDCRG